MSNYKDLLVKYRNGDATLSERRELLNFINKRKKELSKPKKFITPSHYFKDHEKCSKEYTPFYIYKTKTNQTINYGYGNLQNKSRIKNMGWRLSWMLKRNYVRYKRRLISLNRIEFICNK